MSDYKAQFSITDTGDGFGVIHSGPWRFYTGTIEQCRDCMDTMQEKGINTPQDVKAAAAGIRAQFAIRGAILECIGS